VRKPSIKEGKGVANHQTVSIIIPTYKREKDLLRLVASIAKSDYPKDKMEIVVVDNAGELSKEAIQPAAGKTKLKVVWPGSNLYCSGGRLYGVKEASGQYFFFIDDDNILASDCIRHLVDSFNQNPSQGMAGPLMLIYKDKKRIWAAGAKVNSWGMTIHQYGNKYLSEVDLPEVIPDIDYFPNAFMLKRRVLEEVSFDTEHFPHNWSEPDFGLRATMNGYTTATITKAREWHDIDYDGHTTRTDSVKVYDQAKSRILFRRRFFASAREWLTFWCINFPVSTLYYFKAILASPDKKKLAMLAGYVRGTIDGIKTPISIMKLNKAYTTNNDS
jgi:GT2 family glycosyltransferase